MNRTRLALALSFSAALHPGCNSFPSGQHYTLAKVNRQGFLVPAHQVLAPHDTRSGTPTQLPDDRDALIDGYIALSLDWGFVRYLQAIATPEVAVFTRVHVSKPDDTANPPGFIFQSVYMAGDGSDVLASIGKATSVPRLDIAIMPAFKYTNETITVEIRAVELDSADNERAKSLVNLAASVAAVAEPANASAISTFQTVLDFVADSNQDDIEFSYDFQISSQSQESIYASSANESLYAHLPPRVASYVIIKTEDPRRINLPDSYLNVAVDGLLWTASNILQLGTLNILNWNFPFLSDPVGNPYRRLLGNPFAVDTSSTLIPNWRSDGVLGADVAYTGGERSGFFVPGPQDSDYAPFVMKNKALGTVKHESFDDAECAVENEVADHYRDQSYFVVSVSERQAGVSYEELKRLAAANQAVDDLGINVSPRTPEEVEASLQRVKSNAVAVILERQARKTDQKLKEAETYEQRQAIIEAREAELKLLVDNDFLSKAAKEAEVKNLKDQEKAIRIASGEPSLSPELVTIQTDEGENATGLSSGFVLTNSGAWSINEIHLLSRTGSSRLSATQLVRTGPEDPSQTVTFDLQGSNRIDEGSYDVVVRTDANHVIGQIGLWYPATIERVGVLPNGLELSGDNLEHSNEVQVTLAGQSVEAEFTTKDSTVAVTLPEGALESSGSVTLDLTFSDGRPKTKLELKDGFVPGRVIYGKDPLRATSGEAASFSPVTVATPLPEGATYRQEGTWPADVTLDPSTGAIVVDQAAQPVTASSFKVQCTMDGVTLEGSVEIVIEAQPEEEEEEEEEEAAENAEVQDPATEDEGGDQ